MKHLHRAFFIFIILLLSVPAGMDASAMAGQRPTLAPLLIGKGDIIPNQYIIVYKNGRSAEVRSAGITDVENHGGHIRHQYGKVLNGFAAVMTQSEVDRLRQNPDVAYVQADAVVSLMPNEPVSNVQAAAAGLKAADVQASTAQSPATWGLDRIDQAGLPLNNTYNYSYTGSGVNAYIIDTGILSTHTEFGGRASKDFDAIGDGQNGNDCNGHGTHVAGTIGGSTYGVAKNVTLHGVRVLDCGGSGAYSGVIAGVNYVASNRVLPAVANMSLGGGYYAALNDAITNAIAQGVVFVVAAGNSNADACSYSPASTAGAITVGATTSTDARASYSNYGSCLDIFAPGSSITSSWNTSDTATATISGTSMATPHVVGVVALYLQANPSASVASIASLISSNATNDVVTDPAGSVNKLLYSAPQNVVAPTSTPTTAPTATLAPTSTPGIDPTATSIPATPTSEPATPTSIPATATSVPATATPISGLPAATLVSPSGDITSARPAYTWNNVSTATYYYLSVDGPSGALIRQWYTPSKASCGVSTCSVTPNVNLATGAYTWKVQTWNPTGFGPWSTPMAFNKVAPPTPTPLPLPDGATLVSPSGDITTAKPAYTWNKVSSATYYYMVVEGSTGTVLQQWYTSSQAKCGTSTCSVTPNVSLATGSYTWKVQTWSPAGFGAWSTPLAFNKLVPPTPTPLPLPDGATLVSPSGDITTAKPAYTWNKVSSATYYYMVVEGSTGTVLQQWYTSSQAKCGTRTCSVTPNVSLATGSYTWKVQTWSPAGFGAWSTPLAFNKIVPPTPTPLPTPAAVTLTSPTGDIGSNYKPTYAWSKDIAATYYYLVVVGSSGTVLQQWYTTAQAACTAGTCSVTPNNTLTGGTYTWKVQTWSSAGYGPWSAVSTFNTTIIPTATPTSAPTATALPTAGALPSAASLLSPTGSGTSSNPTYTWNKVPGATHYYLWVNGPSGKLLAQWYTSAQANCGATTCSVTTGIAHKPGAYTWKVQTWSQTGYGPWSSARSFTR